MDRERKWNSNERNPAFFFPARFMYNKTLPNRQVHLVKLGHLKNRISVSNLDIDPYIFILLIYVSTFFLSIVKQKLDYWCVEQENEELKGDQKRRVKSRYRDTTNSAMFWLSLILTLVVFWCHSAKGKFLVIFSGANYSQVFQVNAFLTKLRTYTIFLGLQIIVQCAMRSSSYV